jgi:hypothetical protein
MPLRVVGVAFRRAVCLTQPCVFMHLIPACGEFLKVQLLFKIEALNLLDCTSEPHTLRSHF